MKKILVLFLLCICASSLAVSIGERVTVPSAMLDKSHELLIYTPPSYDYNKSQSFPVLYVVDGDYNFHYLTGLIELWSNLSAFMPEMVVVGISGGDTQSYRKSAKPPLEPKSGKGDAGHADVMLDALKKEIMPFVQQTYRVNDFEILGGHSIGGLFVTYAAVHEPQMFDRFIAVSPSLWWQNEIMKDHVAEVLTQNPKLPVHLYMTLANEKGMGVHGFVEMIESQRRNGFDFKFKQFPDETHGSTGLASYEWALFDIFKASRLDGRYFESADAVKTYADELKESLGRIMPIPTGYLRNSCYAWCGDEQQRDEIDQALAALFPVDVAFFRVLVAEHLMLQNKLDEALKWFNQAQKSAPDYVAVYHGLAQLYEKQGRNILAKEARAKVKNMLKTQRIRQWQRNEMKVN
ncbi:alpha/beta hydrolase-fold protein [Marinicella rhabdoformis]|uniref:alpha/beta hydrolase-fold protein n=1 Tax=Marinicella rhabdoformis TaxID=2580566 RepID=UPI0012AEDA4F|nr:alpha/beta hydrolase-fold protein [Marinicella rhabdoformis]